MIVNSQKLQNLHKLQQFIAPQHIKQNQAQRSKYSFCFKIFLFLFVCSLIVAIPFGLQFMRSIENSKNKPKQKGNKIENSTSSRFFSKKNQQLVYIMSNNLKLVLLVSPEQKELCTVSLKVSTGYLNDPPQYRGLSLLLEKMLFLGSKTYPSDNWKQSAKVNDGNIFGNFSSKFFKKLEKMKTIKGSQLNNIINQIKLDFYKSQTYPESQVFTFSTRNVNQFKVFEQWISFFIEPILPFAHLEEEIDKLLKEIEQRFTNQDKAFESILHEISHEGHLFKMQGFEDLRDMKKNLNLAFRQLQEYFEKNYYSENMVFIIKASQSVLDILQGQVLSSLFKEIPSFDIVKYKFKDLIAKQAISTTKQHSLLQNQALPYDHSLYVEVFNRNKANRLFLNTLIPFSEDENDTTLEFIVDSLKYGFQNTSLCSMIEQLTSGKQCSIQIKNYRNSFYTFRILTLEVAFLEKEEFVSQITQIYLHFMKSIGKIPKIRDLFELMQTMREQYFLMYGNTQVSDIDQVEQLSELLQYKRVNEIESFGISLNDFTFDSFKKYINILQDPANYVIVKVSNKLRPPLHGTFVQSNISSIIYHVTREGSPDYPKLFEEKIQLQNLIEKRNITELEKSNDNQKYQNHNEAICLTANGAGIAVIQYDAKQANSPLQIIQLHFSNLNLRNHTHHQAIYSIFAEYFRQEINRVINSLDVKVDIEQIQSYRGFQITISLPPIDQIITIKNVIDIIKNSENILTSNQIAYEKYRTSSINTLKIRGFTMTLEEQIIDIFDSIISKSIVPIQMLVEQLETLDHGLFSNGFSELIQHYHLFLFAYGNVKSKDITELFHSLSKNETHLNYAYEDQYLSIQQNFKNKINTESLNYNHQSSAISNFYIIGKIKNQQPSDSIFIQSEIDTLSLKFLNNNSLDCKINPKLIIRYHTVGLLIIASDCAFYKPNIISQYMDKFVDLFKKKFQNITYEEEFQKEMKKNRQRRINANNIFQQSDMMRAMAFNRFYKEDEKSNEQKINNLFKLKNNTIGKDQFLQFLNTSSLSSSQFSIRVLKNSLTNQNHLNLTSQIENTKKQTAYSSIVLYEHSGECSNNAQVMQ